MKTKDGLRRALAAVVVLLLAAAMMLCCGCNKNAETEAAEKTSPHDEETSMEEVVEYIDAEKYFEESGEIKETLNAKDSKDVKTEKAISEEFAARGFGELEITYDYSMDGDLLEEAAADATSTEKHPIYQALYVTDSEMVWTLTVVNGAIIANPLSYNAASEGNVSVLLSESETLTSYDVVTNQFFVTVPNTDTVLVKTVDTIDAATLESLTKEGIDAL